MIGPEITSNFGPDALKAIGGGIIGLTAVIFGGKKLFWNFLVSKANAGLDVTALTASGQVITGLQQEMARLREDMERMEKRLADLGAQLDAEVTSRRRAEEASSQLRVQVRRLGEQPVA